MFSLTIEFFSHVSECRKWVVMSINSSIVFPHFYYNVFKYMHKCHNLHKYHISSVIVSNTNLSNLKCEEYYKNRQYAGWWDGSKKKCLLCKSHYLSSTPSMCGACVRENQLQKIVSELHNHAIMTGVPALVCTYQTHTVTIIKTMIK